AFAFHQGISKTLLVWVWFEVYRGTQSDHGSNIRRGKLVFGQVFRVRGDQQGQVRPGAVTYENDALRITPFGLDVVLDPGEDQSDIFGLRRELMLGCQAMAG